jgi:hypothetical protein
MAAGSPAVEPIESGSRSHVTDVRPCRQRWYGSETSFLQKGGRKHPGSIILLHPWSRQSGASRRALPMILAALAARRYACVTVSELLAGR